MSAPVPGRHIEYEMRGEDEPVLLIHGTGIATAILPWMDDPRFAEYRLIRLHRRRHSGSSQVG